MTIVESYTDIHGQVVDLRGLDEAERGLFDELQTQAQAHPDPDAAEFFNYWMPRLASFYESRGLTRKQITQLPLWPASRPPIGSDGPVKGENQC